MNNMEFTFETQNTYSYLVYEIKPEDEIDKLSLGMITNNKINELAGVIYTQMDEKKYLKYNITAKVSVKQFFSGTVNRNRLLGVFSSIVNALIVAEDYMLEQQTLILDLDYIFVDVSTCRAVLICLPVMDAKYEPVDLKEFFKKIVFSTQFDQSEDCGYIATIINYLNSSNTFSVAVFKKVLEDISLHYRQNVSMQRVDNRQQIPVQGTRRPIVTPPQGPGMQSNAVPLNRVQPSMQRNSMPNQFQNQIAPSPNKSGIGTSMKNGTLGGRIPNKEVEKKKSKWSLFGKNKDKKLKKKVKEAKNSVTSVNTPFPVPPMSTQPPFAIPGQQGVLATDHATTQEEKAGINPMQNKQQLVFAQPPMPTIPQPLMPNALSSMHNQPDNFGETTILEGENGLSGETTILEPSSMSGGVHPYLWRRKNNEKILLDKPLFRIGKEKSFVDYFIGDNTSISRSHANIIKREEKYYIVDTNSTNHTYVNGAMIQSNTEVELKHGNSIVLSNEEFEFKMY